MTEKKVSGLDGLGKVLSSSHGADFKTMLLTMLEQLMAAEANTLCGAAYEERSSERVNSRNGYRDRPFETRLGTLDLRIPKLRQGAYFPSFLEPRRRWEQAFVNVVSEAYVLGVSTRRVEGLMEAMGAKGVSRSDVSRMAVQLDEQVKAFRERPLLVGYPYLYLDAIYVKMRENGHVVSRAVLVAYGVSENGERSVLGVDVAMGEAEDCWRRFLQSLKRRGLKGVQLAISDAHDGIRAAVRAVINGVAWQRCTVHFRRDMISHTPKNMQALISGGLRNVFSQPGPEQARQALRAFAQSIEGKLPQVAALVDEAEPDILNYMSFPAAHWRQIHSTNPLERLNREIRRRTDVVGIFPHADSALRLIGMVLNEQDDEWAVARHYFSKESMAALLAPPPRAEPAPPPLPAKTVLNAIA